MSLTTTPSSWPAVILGLVMGIYWLRVLQMVLQTKRTVGRAANFVPPEPLGRLLRIIWIPVVILWILIPLLVPFLVEPPSILRPLAFPGGQVAGWAAVGVALVAFGLTWVCWVNMGTSWRMGIDPNEKTVLVFNGPFAYVRNPIYGLSQLLVLCSLAAWPAPAMIAVAAIHLAFMQWEVRREEKYLRALHGPPYEAYLRNVPRFLPRPTPWR
jgi:protein-S-isoprenylcysteine O-methyltransferase Ste14